MFAKVHAVAQQVGQIVVGKEVQIRQALVCLLAGGHLLIEDVPGVGKTTLAHALAISLGPELRRIFATCPSGMNFFDGVATSTSPRRPMSSRSSRCRRT